MKAGRSGNGSRWIALVVVVRNEATGDIQSQLQTSFHSFHAKTELIGGRSSLDHLLCHRLPTFLRRPALMKRNASNTSPDCRVDNPNIPTTSARKAASEQPRSSAISRRHDGWASATRLSKFQFIRRGRPPQRPVSARQLCSFLQLAEVSRAQFARRSGLRGDAAHEERAVG